MSVRVTVTCAERTPEDLQALVDEMTADLGQLLDVEAVREEIAAPPGARGAAISVGGILMTFLSGGGAVAAINVIRAYFNREPALKMRVKGAKGSEFEISAKNLDATGTKRLMALIRKAAGRGR